MPRSVHPALLALTLGCGTSAKEATAPADTTDTTDTAPTTDADLAVFYDTYGGRDAFPEHHVTALEALLYAQDALEAGDRDDARARIDAVLETMPLSDAIWREEVGYGGANIGDPVAYYGLRMLDQILRLGEQPTTGTLRMTAVVAPCAQVSRPTLPDLTSETVSLDIDPTILADDAHTLHTSTALFRSWVEAITGGRTVELVVYEMSDCTTVTYTDDGEVIVSYPDATGMVDSVPDDIALETDFWWVVAPSGVPGDGSGYDRHFITGGMGGYGAGLPLFLSDDAWFTRKPEHLGSGAYTEVELRAYQPQWFQHEFMHHLFRTWPEFGLEDTDHQWFDRTTWPDDFEGVYEPDYYIEAVDKRLLAASPTLAEGLAGPEWADPESLDATMLVGSYQREPVQNGWHEVVVTNDDGLRWSNADGVSWSLEIRDGALWAGDDCPYGASELAVELEEDSAVAVLWFSGEAYQRVD
ncbi:MAG: hypothetical protein ACI8RZ_005205 [Myxococcota bacterium]|jgi:hypothetical protein